MGNIKVKNKQNLYLDDNLDDKFGDKLEEFDPFIHIKKVSNIEDIINTVKKEKYDVIFLDENLDNNLLGSSLVGIICKLLSPYTIIILVSDQESSIKEKQVYRILSKDKMNLEDFEEVMESHEKNTEKLNNLKLIDNTPIKGLIENNIDYDKIMGKLNSDLDYQETRIKTLNELVKIVDELKGKYYEE